MSQDPSSRPSPPSPQEPASSKPQKREADGGGTKAARHNSRTGAIWAATTVSIVLLILLIIFILQNSGSVSIVFFGLQGSVPLGMALLIAAVGGAAVVAIAGIARLAQVRINERRARRHPD